MQAASVCASTVHVASHGSMSHPEEPAHLPATASWGGVAGCSPLVAPCCMPTLPAAHACLVQGSPNPMIMPAARTLTPPAACVQPRRQALSAGCRRRAGPTQPGSRAPPPHPSRGWPAHSTPSQCVPRVRPASIWISQGMIRVVRGSTVRASILRGPGQHAVLLRSARQGCALRMSRAPGFRVSLDPCMPLLVASADRGKSRGGREPARSAAVGCVACQPGAAARSQYRSQLRHWRNGSSEMPCLNSPSCWTCPRAGLGCACDATACALQDARALTQTCAMQHHVC